jgi:hypothetical protein
MNIQQRLNHVVDRYRAQGYQVVIRPGPEDLPPFAKDFKVEIVATRNERKEKEKGSGVNTDAVYLY